MNIGILTVNTLEFHPNGRLDEAAKGLGHCLQLINPYALTSCLKDGGACTAFAFSGGRPDVVLPRQGAPMGEYGLVILRQLGLMGIPLVNGLDAVTIARNQYITLQTLAASGIPVPDSCFVTREDSFFEAVAHLGGFPVVAKQVGGMGGDGVALIENETAGRRFLASCLDSAKGLVVQCYLPPEGRTDIRVLVVGKKVVGAMGLTPAHGEFRANVNREGTAVAMDPPQAWQETALDAARACGLDIAGIDMIVEKNGHPRVIEVNYSPGFKGMEAATGKDIARKIVAYAVRTVKKAAGYGVQKLKEDLV